jgi:GTPase
MLDKVELKLKAGDGGNGAVTFRREKFVPFGGPFGGDGGRGGDILVQANASVNTLRQYLHRRDFKSENGQGGMSKNKHGADGANLVLNVPPGTLVHIKRETGELDLVADLERDSQQVLVARGGRGGWGNIHYATPTNQTPRTAQPGSPGEEKIIVLELRLIADVGIIGYPNVGKSSLLAALSQAHPEIADYPFTTLEPVLGVVGAEKGRFILAEIPGLIEGAHQGKGLGLEFLRHAMRTKLFIHLLNGLSPSPLEDMIKVNNELALFDATLAKRPQVIAVNKVDLPEVNARRQELKDAFAEAELNPLFISAAAGEGLKELVAETLERLKEADLRAKLAAPLVITPTKVFHPGPVDQASGVQKKGRSFIVSDPELERLLDKFDLSDPVDTEAFYKRIEDLGIYQSIKSAGAKSGDTMITGNIEWEWYEDEHRRDGRNL